MSQEIEVTHHECLCQKRGFRKFLIVALGTFVGVFCALSLFCALHKPPMMVHPMFMGGTPMHPALEKGYRHFYYGGDVKAFKCHKKMKELQEKLENDD